MIVELPSKPVVEGAIGGFQVRVFANPDGPTPERRDAMNGLMDRIAARILADPRPAAKDAA